MIRPSPLPPPLALWAVFALVAVLWFATLDCRTLLHPDEGRYAEIAREMAASGDWITPRLNDLKYFEKPPFQYWVTAAADRLFGVHAWTARLWPAVAGFLAVIALGAAGFALGGPALGVVAALALAGTLWHAALAQIVTLDSGLAFFLALAFSAFVVAQRAESGVAARRGWMALAWAALAGATLSKGPVGIAIPAGALVVYTAATRDFAVWRRLSLIVGIVVYLALTVPWFVAVGLRNDEFLRFFFVHEHLQRFLTTEARRVGPWYYFVPFALAGSLPWLAVLAFGARRAWCETANALGFSWQRFALCWAAFVLVFFSVSESKLPSYILPMFAPLALVAAWLLLALAPRTLWRIAWPGAVAIAALAMIVPFVYGTIVGASDGDAQPIDVMLAFEPWLEAALLTATVGAVAGALAFRRAESRPARRFWGTAALAVSTLAATQLVVAGFDVFSATRSSSAILRAAQAVERFAPGAPFYQIGMYDQTIPFYLRRPTTVVAFRDELALGIDAEPEKAIDTVGVWRQRWDSLDQGYAVMSPATYAQIEAAGVPMRVLARDTRRVIVARK
jgi:4-amino-4-deoxy-L-arabinose transferase-like glycosyltransferase